MTIQEVRQAKSVIAEHISPAPLIRSYRLEKELSIAANRRVWLKDFGWTPVGSFKLLGALNLMAGNLSRIGDRPVTAHSSGNFASGIAFAGMRYKKRVIIVMPGRQTLSSRSEMTPIDDIHRKHMAISGNSDVAQSDWNVF